LLASGVIASGVAVGALAIGEDHAQAAGRATTVGIFEDAASGASNARRVGAIAVGVAAGAIALGVLEMVLGVGHSDEVSAPP
jgi:hypothetical protein